MKDLSIVVVNYNTKKLTLRCIQSIQKHTKGINYEIILVDNGSTDGSVKYFEKLSILRKIRLIRSDKNLGFGAGNNLGIKKALAKYILLLNSDTLINKNILPEMVDWMEGKENVGVISCALKNRDGSEQETGGYFPNLLKVFAWMTFVDDIPYLDRLIKPFHPMHSQSLYKNVLHFKKEREVDWLTGAFMLIKKEVLDKVGYFDEDYFMYTEEVDLCWRIKKAGWRVLYLPKWSIIHLGGGSGTKEDSLLKEYEGVKIFYKKHKPTWQYPMLRILLKFGAILRIIIMGLSKGGALSKTYAKAFKIA